MNLTLSVIVFLLIGFLYTSCSSNNSKDITRSFNELNNPIEKEPLTNQKSEVKTNNDIKRIKSITKGTSNFFINQINWLIKYSEDEAFGTEYPNGTIHNNHYKIDDDGYYQLFPIDHLNKKDDLKTSQKMFIGEYGVENPSGIFISDSLIYFRNRICDIIANYKSKEGKEWFFYPPYEYKGVEGNVNQEKDFELQLTKALQKANPKDTSVIKEIYSILTPPEKTIRNSKEISWIGAQFDKAPLITVIAIFESFRTDLFLVEKIAIKHIKTRVSNQKETPNHKLN